MLAICDGLDAISTVKKSHGTSNLHRRTLSFTGGAQHRPVRQQNRLRAKPSSGYPMAETQSSVLWNTS